MDGPTTAHCTGRDIILTTPGGSGSTFFCEALNSLPNVVALNEPIPLRLFRGATTQEVCEQIRARFRNARARLGRHGKAAQLSRDANGRLHLRPADFGIQTEPFDLVIKQPLTFTALIGRPELSDFEWYALVRNPLLTLCSWVKHNLQAGRQGRATTAERHAPELGRRLARLAANGVCKEELRLALLNWAFRQYARLPYSSVIRFEHFVASPVDALALIIPAAALSHEQLPLVENANVNLAHQANAQRFAPGVLKEPASAPLWRYYSKYDVWLALHALNSAATPGTCTGR